MHQKSWHKRNYFRFRVLRSKESVISSKYSGTFCKKQKTRKYYKKVVKTQRVEFTRSISTKVEETTANNYKTMAQIFASPMMLENSLIELHPKSNINAFCLNCQENIISTSEVRMGFLQWVCFWFPCVKKDLEVVHACPNCKFQVARFINGKLHLNE